MSNNHQRHLLNDLLNLLTNPVHKRRQQTRVLGPNGYRTLGETTDDTGIGDQNETDNQIAITEYILDCGHTAKDDLGGICHYCDSIICKNCIALCSSCGHSTCPQCSLITDFDGQNKRYCRTCAEEIEHNLRLRAIGRAIFSWFIPKNNKK